MRRPILLAAAALVILAGAFALSRGATAQDDATDEHPLVGSWVLTFPDDPGVPPSLYTFSADGTVIGTNVQGTRHGAWESTGPQTADMTIVGYPVGPVRIVSALVIIHAQAEVDPSGDRLTITYTVTAGDGMPERTTGPFTAAGERITVEPMPEVTPAPATPIASPNATPVAEA